MLDILKTRGYDVLKKRIWEVRPMKKYIHLSKYNRLFGREESLWCVKDTLENFLAQMASDKIKVHIKDQDLLNVWAIIV
jgi:hypothetical protein